MLLEMQVLCKYIIPVNACVWGTFLEGTKGLTEEFS